MKQKLGFSITLVIVFYSIISVAQPSLPGITSAVSVSYSPDIGMGKPAITTPGGSFTFKLTGIQDQPKSGYIWTVVLNGEKLAVLNYTVAVSYSAGSVSVSLPTSVKPGLYDLVLQGQSEVEIPRSVWVFDQSKESLKIIHISDQHYGAGQPDVITGDMNRVAGYIVSTLLNPDLIIDTGDVADTASEQQYRWAYAYESAFLYSYPILAIPGNHDTPPDAWNKYYGSTTWFRLIGDRLLIIGLYSLEQGYPPMEQLQWAEGILKQYSQVPIKVILVHHPVFYYQGELKTTYDDQNVITPYDPQKNPNSPIYSSWSGNMNVTRYFLRLVEQYGVNYVLSGHVHRDLFVKYTSTRTGKTTYFLTITTLGMGSAIYDGLDFYLLNLKTGQLDFPVKPPTFIGFAPDNKKLAENSIPVGIYPPLNNLGAANQTFTPMALYQWPHAYVLKMENKLSYLNLNNTVIWCLPWSGDFAYKVLSSEGGAEFNIVDKLSIGGKLFLAVRMKLPPQGKMVVALYNAPDNNPPTATVKMVIPAKPTPGGTFQAYVDVADDSWGIASISAKLIAGGTEVPLTPQFYAPGTILDPLTKITYKLVEKIPSTTGDVKLIVKAVDFAGRESTTEYTLVSAQQPTQTTQPSQPQQPQQPTNITQPQQPSQPTPQTGQAPTGAQGGLSPVVILLGILLAVAVLLLGVLAFRRSRKRA
ncbi:MAG: metallophosphoesterase [Infirmifilum sp.]